MAISSRSASLAEPIQLKDLIELLRSAVPDLLVLEPSSGTCGAGLIGTVALDSREAGSDSVFVAIKGERVDGHSFLVDLAKKSVPCAFVSKDVLLANPEYARHCQEAGMVLVAAGSGEEILQAWARLWRASFANLLVLGVTGSSGKTTVKDMLQAVLSPRFRTWASPGNLNSILGSPLAVLAMARDTECAIFEMAMSEPGEMVVLARMIHPRYALITNIGLAHVANLGSQDAIALEKKQITACFDETCHFFVPARDRYADFLARDVAGTVHYYGADADRADTWRPDGEGGQYMTVPGGEIHIPLSGAHIRSDALAVYALALSLGLSPDEVIKGFGGFQPGFGRGQILKGNRTVILDCYNANPDSMEAAIVASVEYGLGSRRVLILGDMLELGAESGAAHRRIGRVAVESGSELIVFHGAEMAQAHDEALMTRKPDSECSIRHYPDFASLSLALAGLLQDGDQILLKASRGMALERLLPFIQETAHV